MQNLNSLEDENIQKVNISARESYDYYFEDRNIVEQLEKLDILSREEGDTDLSDKTAVFWVRFWRSRRAEQWSWK